MMRQGIVAGLVMALASGLYGYPLPIETATISGFVVTVTLFVGYVYLMRSLLRLPFALYGTRRKYRHAREHYQLNKREALIEAVYRGGLDQRRWEHRTLAVLDRTLYVLIVWAACQPGFSALLVRGVGLLGVIVLMMLYLFTGSFAGLVDDGLSGTSRPFNNFPNLRRSTGDF